MKYIKIIYEHKFLILLSITSFVTLSVIYTYILIKPKFEATATVVSTMDPASKNKLFVLDKDRLSATLRNENTVKLAMEKVGVRGISKKGIVKSVEPLSLKIDRNEHVKISYQGANPIICADIANAFAAVLVDEIKKNTKSREESIEVKIESAKPPVEPLFPNNEYRKNCLIVGVILGFFAGIGMAIYFEEKGIDEKINEIALRNSELPPSHIINFNNKYLNAIALIITAILVLAVILAVPLFILDH